MISKQHLQVSLEQVQFRLSIVSKESLTSEIFELLRPCTTLAVVA
jgi:hypothetical protein